MPCFVEVVASCLSCPESVAIMALRFRAVVRIPETNADILRQIDMRLQVGSWGKLQWSGRGALGAIQTELLIGCCRQKLAALFLPKSRLFFPQVLPGYWSD
jgi:hypothetical protein